MLLPFTKCVSEISILVLFSLSEFIIVDNTNKSAIADIEVGTNGEITNLTITNKGKNYVKGSEVTIEQIVVSEDSARAVAHVESGVIKSVDINNSASISGKYTSQNLIIENSSSDGTSAELIASFGNGVISNISLTNAGTGYNGDNEVILVSDNTGKEAKADITVNDSGVIQTLTLREPGVDYSNDEVVTLKQEQIEFEYTISPSAVNWDSNNKTNAGL